MRALCAALLALCLLALPAAAQNATPDLTPDLTPESDPLAGTGAARFATSNAAPLTGQPFTLTLIIDLPPGAQLTETPQFPARWGAFDVRTVGALTRTADRATQEITVILWRPGDYATPETFIGFTQGGPQDTRRVPVTVQRLTVPSVIDMDNLTLRPFRPPVERFYLPPLLALALGLLLTVAGGVGYTAWKKRPAAAASPQFARSPAQRFAEDLEHVAESAHGAQVAAAANALRVYLKARFAVDAVSLTTDETLAALDGHLDARTLPELARLLHAADVLKFSGDTGHEGGDAAVTVEQMAGWVRAVEHLSQAGR